MVFLKRIEAYGFKSFADPISLNFEYGMTGIVGPNGSGKSNINDAIRWTLGEQSLKSLRGDSMDDIVFSGSQDKKPYNVAEVTLVFDNSNNVFSNFNFAEVSIKRRYDKNTNESEYFINNNKVRQKDVQEVAIETGLTKSSLAIISQGSVNQFVEAKPEERRALFDEAAGVAKYKKRKDEAIRKLVRTNENLDRVNDLINEIERKLPSLKKQSEKAKIYKEKEQELKKNEVSFLVSDIKAYNSKIDLIESEKINYSEKLSDVRHELNKYESNYKRINFDVTEYEKQVDNLSEKYSSLVEKTSKLEIKKISLQNKSNSTKISEVEHRVDEVKRLLQESAIKINNEKENLEELMNSEMNLNESLINLSKIRREANEKLDVIRKKLNKIELKIESLNNRKNSSEFLFEGVKNILDNKNVLPGIVGIVQDLVSIDEKYVNAIGAFLQQGVLQNIVIDSATNVKVAIDFLKSNKAGQATFLPLDTLRPNNIDNEKRFVIQNCEGFINFANELVNIEKKYRLVTDYLLGAVIVIDNYEHALEAAKLIKYKFNIVTLDGERILPQGAINGGSRKKTNIFSTLSKELEIFDAEKNNLENIENEQNKVVSDSSAEIDLIRERISTNKSTIGAVTTVIKSLQIEEEKLKDEFRILTGKSFDDQKEGFSIDGEIEKIINDIARYNQDKTSIANELEVARKMKNKLREQLFNESKNVETLRNKLSSYKDILNQKEMDLTLLRERKMTAASRLAQAYHLTVESALQLETVQIDNEEEVREKIIQLRSDLSSIGNVNLDSIEEYQNENKRYEEFILQANDIRESVNNLSEAIKNMDVEMLKQFRKVIKDVNESLPLTFKNLFGGGDAKIIYTDPNDILNSGIDIKINPPGKKITNLNLLSGGEKSLVALTVLFSILSVRPLPLVILDEVEAPLDIANVERFAKYIKSFTNKTQFVIVTHRIGTMENCEILYGATMEQKGITKIVNIKLVDAKKITNAN